MSMLSSSNRYSPDYIEGVVLFVDADKYRCSVKTVNGKILQDVIWLMPTGGSSETGMHITPNVRDMVLISTSLGYPVILGCLPIIGLPNQEIISITGAAGASPKTTSTLQGSAVANPGKPSDLIPGDFVYSTKGGGLISVMASGISILRASSLAQIIFSKYEGLGRLVARNYQRFSDSSSFVSSSMVGRLYTWFGMDWNISNNRNGTERYQEVYGDVAAGEVLRGVPGPGLSIPAQDTRVIKKWLKNDSGAEVMSEVLLKDGTITVTIGGSSGSVYEITPSSVKITSPVITLAGIVTCTTGATGVFTTPTGSTVTVQDGIITNIV